jgi:hypothetical protein
MREGLLWYDGDKRRSPQDKLDLAATRYAERFGRRPDTCHVHPAELFEHPLLRVVPDPAVLPNHFWIGEDEELAAARSQRPAARRRRKIA